MKVSELAEKIKCKIYCGLQGEENEIVGCYIGDLLSLAMSRIEKGNIWITIQTNINIAAVATLTEAGGILLCDGFIPDKNTAERANNEGIPILTSSLSAYELAGKIMECGI